MANRFNPSADPVVADYQPMQLDGSIFKRGDLKSTGDGMVDFAKGLSAYGEAQNKKEIASIEQAGAIGKMAIGAVDMLAGKAKQNLSQEDQNLNYQINPETGDISVVGPSDGAFAGAANLFSGGGQGKNFFSDFLNGGDLFSSAASETTAHQSERLVGNDGQGGGTNGEAVVSGPGALAMATFSAGPAAAHTQIKNTLTDAALNQFRGDPKGLSAFVNTYANKLMGDGSNKAQMQLSEMAREYGGQLWRSALADKADHQIKTAHNELTAQLDSQVIDLKNIARTYPGNDFETFIHASPAFQKVLDTSRAISDNPAINGSFGPAKREAFIAETLQSATNAHVEGRALAIRDSQGSEAAYKYIDAHTINNSSANVPFELKEQGRQNAYARVNFYTEQEKVLRDQSNKAAQDVLSKQYETNLRAFTPSELMQYGNQFARNKAPEAAMAMFTAAQVRNRTVEGLKGLPAVKAFEMAMGNGFANFQQGAAASAQRANADPYQLNLVQQYSGRHVGESEECVALVKEAVPSLGNTHNWQPGGAVNGNTAPGTPIATFGGDGVYKNKRGESHAAIYLGPGSTPGSIRVLDQWRGHKAGEREIKPGVGAEGAENFQVIQTRDGAAVTPPAINNNPFAYGPGGNGSTAGSSAAGIIRHFEGFRSGTYWDVNHHRVGYGSDTITLPDGSHREVQQGMTVTREDADRDLNRRVNETQRHIVSDIGQEAWNRLTPGARDALTSFAYNYGVNWAGKAGPVAEAARSGNSQALAQAIYQRGSDNGGVNRKRREMEANIAMGGAAPADHAANFASSNPQPMVPPFGGYVGRNSPIPFTPAEIGANPLLLSQAVHALTADTRSQADIVKQTLPIMEDMLKKGLAPDDKLLAGAIQFSRANPQLFNNEDLAEKFRGIAEGSKDALRLQGVDATEYVNRAERAAIESPDIYHRAYADTLRDQLVGAAKMAKERPFDYAKQTGIIRDTPIEWGKTLDCKAFGNAPLHEVVGTKLAQNRVAGAALASNTGQPLLSMTFPQNEMKGLSEFLANTDGMTANNLLTAVAVNLKPTEFSAFTGNNDVSAALKGLANSADPLKAMAGNSFLEKAYQSNPTQFNADMQGMKEQVARYMQDVRYNGPEYAMKMRMQEATSMAQDKAYDERLSKARTDLNSFSVNDVMKALDLPASASGGMMSMFSDVRPMAPNKTDWGGEETVRTAFTDQMTRYMALGLDRDAASKKTAEYMRNVYARSQFADDHVMSYAPELRYSSPAALSNFQFRLTSFVAQQAVKNGIHLDNGAMFGPTMQSNTFLLSDQQTADEWVSRKKNGEPVDPTYLVQVRAADGQTHLLMGEDGQALRFSVNAAEQEAGTQWIENKMMADRNTNWWTH